MRNFTLIIFLTLTISISGFSFNHAVFFSDRGERFNVYINGVEQSVHPASTICIKEIPLSELRVQIVFDNPALRPISRLIQFSNRPSRWVFRIKLNKKGRHVIRYYDEDPLPCFIPAIPGQHEVYYAPPVNNSCTSHSTITNNSTPINNQPDHYVLNGYNGPIGCPWPMNDQAFKDAVGAVKSQSFSNSRLEVAKQIVNTNCLFAEQVAHLTSLMGFENDKLEFAKYAYNKTYDVGNYYKVNDAFSFSSSSSRLNKYISAR